MQPHSKKQQSSQTQYSHHSGPYANQISKQGSSSSQQYHSNQSTPAKDFKAKNVVQDDVNNPNQNYSRPQFPSNKDPFYPQHQAQSQPSRGRGSFRPNQPQKQQYLPQQDYPKSHPKKQYYGQHQFAQPYQHQPNCYQVHHQMIASNNQSFQNQGQKYSQQNMESIPQQQQYRQQYTHYQQQQQMEHAAKQPAKQQFNNKRWANKGQRGHPYGQRNPQGKRIHQSARGGNEPNPRRDFTTNRSNAYQADIGSDYGEGEDELELEYSSQDQQLQDGMKTQIASNDHMYKRKAFNKNKQASQQLHQLHKYDVLYSEKQDGEIMIYTDSQIQEFRISTVIDISTLYKEKRIQAVKLAEALQELNHPNLLNLTQNFRLKGPGNGLLEFTTESPDHITGWKSFCKKKFTLEEILLIFRQLMTAMEYLHSNDYTHRDVHPTRIHLSNGVTKFNLIGMPYNYKKLLKKESFCGHVNYSAPELLQQDKIVFDSKVDIWSLGCCLYYLCTKRDPFEGQSPAETKSLIMSGKLEKPNDFIEPIAKKLIYKCLEKDQYKRFTATEMIQFQDEVEMNYFNGKTISKDQHEQLLQQEKEHLIQVEERRRVEARNKNLVSKDQQSSSQDNQSHQSFNESAHTNQRKSQYQNNKFNSPSFFMAKPNNTNQNLKPQKAQSHTQKLSNNQLSAIGEILSSDQKKKEFRRICSDEHTQLIYPQQIGLSANKEPSLNKNQSSPNTPKKKKQLQNFSDKAANVELIYTPNLNKERSVINSQNLGEKHDISLNYNKQLDSNLNLGQGIQQDLQDSSNNNLQYQQQNQVQQVTQIANSQIFQSKWLLPSSLDTSVIVPKYQQQVQDTIIDESKYEEEKVPIKGRYQDNIDQDHEAAMALQFSLNQKKELIEESKIEAISENFQNFDFFEKSPKTSFIIPSQGHVAEIQASKKTSVGSKSDQTPTSMHNIRPLSVDFVDVYRSKSQFVNNKQIKAFLSNNMLQAQEQLQEIRRNLQNIEKANQNFSQNDNKASHIKLNLKNSAQDPQAQNVLIDKKRNSVTFTNTPIHLASNLQNASKITFNGQQMENQFRQKMNDISKRTEDQNNISNLIDTSDKSPFVGSLNNFESIFDTDVIFRRNSMNSKNGRPLLVISQVSNSQKNLQIQKQESDDKLSSIGGVTPSNIISQVIFEQNESKTSRQSQFQPLSRTKRDLFQDDNFTERAQMLQHQIGDDHIQQPSNIINQPRLSQKNLLQTIQTLNNTNSVDFQLNLTSNSEFNANINPQKLQFRSNISGKPQLQANLSQQEVQNNNLIKDPSASPFKIKLKKQQSIQMMEQTDKSVSNSGSSPNNKLTSLKDSKNEKTSGNVSLKKSSNESRRTSGSNMPSQIANSISLLLNNEEETTIKITSGPRTNLQTDSKEGSQQIIDLNISQRNQTCSGTQLVVHPGRPQTQSEQQDKDQASQQSGEDNALSPNHILKRNQVYYSDGSKYVGSLARKGYGIYHDSDGGIYDGEWEDDKRNGNGKQLFSDGSVYDGRWSNDKMHGQGIYTAAFGDRYEGFFVQGLKSGLGKLTYQSGHVYSGQFQKDTLNGHGTFTFKNGNIYIGEFQDGAFHGKAQMKYIGKGDFTGHFQDGMIHGQGRIDYLDGSYYAGQWFENQMHGFGVLFDIQDNSTYEGQWQRGQKNGQGTLTYHNQYQIEGIYHNGELVQMIRFNNYDNSQNPFVNQ